MILKKKSYGAIIVMVVFLLVANKASAVPVPTFGDTTSSGSWTQTLIFPSPISIGALELFIVTDAGAGGVDIPGMSNFLDDLLDPTDWTGSVVNPNYALATGTDAFQQFDAHFAGDIDLGLTSIWLFWEDTEMDVLAAALEATYDGSSTSPWALDHWAVRGDGTNFSFLEGFNPDRTPAPVPEPATIFLLGSGLAGMVFYRRRPKII